MTTILYVVAVTALWGLSLVAIEYFRFKDGGKPVLITTEFREAVKEVPWVFILLALVTGFLMGHCAG